MTRWLTKSVSQTRCLALPIILGIHQAVRHAFRAVHSQVGRDFHHDRGPAGRRRLHIRYVDSLVKSALQCLTEFTVVSLKSYPEGLFYTAMALGVYVSYFTRTHTAHTSGAVGFAGGRL